MKMSRKILAAFLAILFAMGTFIFTVSAEGTPSGTENMQVAVTTSKTQANPGDIITVTINVKNNYYATNMRWPVLFSSTVFELVGVDGGVQASGQLAAVGSSLRAVLVDETNNNDLFPSGYSKTKYDALLIQWIGNVNNGIVNCYKSETGSNCITFNLKVKATPTASSGKIDIPSALGNKFYYQAMNDPANSSTIYTMNSLTCTMTFTNAAVSVYSSKPDIAPADGTKTVIHRFSESEVTQIGHNGYIFGLPNDIFFYPLQYENEIYDYIQPVGGATLKITSAAGQSNYGTGTKIEVVNAGVTIATYYLAIIGDIDGNGTVDYDDFIGVDKASQYLVDWAMNGDIYSNAFYFASDLNGDGACDGFDYNVMDSVLNQLYYVHQDRTPGIIKPGDLK